MKLNIEWPKEREWPADMGGEATQEEVMGYNKAIRKCKQAVEKAIKDVEERTINFKEIKTGSEDIKCPHCTAHGLLYGICIYCGFKIKDAEKEGK